MESMIQIEKNIKLWNIAKEIREENKLGKKKYNELINCCKIIETQILEKDIEVPTKEEIKRRIRLN